MKFVVYSLGCKVNQYEGQAIVKRLAACGHHVSTEWEKADAYILNTCSITAEADKKSRQLVAKAARFNPNAPVYICGCSSQYASEQYQNRPNVRLISGTAGKNAFVEHIMSDITGQKRNAEADDSVKSLPVCYEDDLLPEATRTRAYIKIQDGCNNFCSYCIVPYLRGRSRSRPVESVLAEARTAATVSRELVLTGINLSAYGKDIGSDLETLIRALADIDARKRLGSLECGVISPSLLAAMRQAGFCDHFHLSLQSGCDSVLRRMNRHYDMCAFGAKVEMIRDVFPNAGITTDIITGFPEETDSEHRQSLENVERIAFSDIHVFPYSQRRGTVADSMRQVPQDIRIARAHTFGELKERLRQKFFDAQRGTQHNVYLETTAGDYAEGYTENYIKTYVLGAAVDTVVPVRLQENYLQGVKGELL